MTIYGTKSGVIMTTTTGMNACSQEAALQMKRYKEILESIREEWQPVSEGRFVTYVKNLMEIQILSVMEEAEFDVIIRLLQHICRDIQEIYVALPVNMFSKQEALFQFYQRSRKLGLLLSREGSEAAD